VKRIAEAQAKREAAEARAVEDTAARESLASELTAQRRAASERSRLENAARAAEAKASRAEASAAAERAAREALEARVASARNRAAEASARAAAEASARAAAQAEAARVARGRAVELNAAAAQASTRRTRAAPPPPPPPPAASRWSWSTALAPVMAAPASYTAQVSAFVYPIAEAIPKVAPVAIGVPVLLVAAGLYAAEVWRRVRRKLKRRAAERASELKAEEEKMKARWRDIVYAPPSPRELELLSAAKGGRREGGAEAPVANGTQRAARRAETSQPPKQLATQQQPDAAQWIAAWRWKRAAVAANSGAGESEESFWDDAALGGEGMAERETEWSSDEAKAQKKEFQRFMRDIRGT